MPFKSGGSHAFSAFASMLVATVISKYVWQHTPSFVEVSRAVGNVLVTVTSVELSPRFAGTLLIATLLTFLWGIFYELNRR